jgi:hypothetical protein
MLEKAQSAQLPSDMNCPYIAPLTQMGLIEVAGSDAASFLQNMFTNDVSVLQHGQAQLNGLCNPKGRLLAIFLVIKQGDEFLLWLPGELIESIIQRLSMFKLRSDVTLTQVEDKYTVGHFDNTHNISGTSLITLPAAPTIQLAILEQSQLATFSKDIPIISECVWLKAWLEAGLPMIFKSSQEAFTPQQVNLDLVDGVSFKKGCYPGQEVVARLHYLGKPSRRLFSAVLNGDNLPSPNTEVLSGNDDVLGHVVNAVKVGEMIFCQLTLKLDQVDETGFVLGQAVEQLRPCVMNEP